MMKRATKNLDTGNLNTENDVETSNKKKKVRFEKPLDNKSIGKNKRIKIKFEKNIKITIFLQVII